MKGSFHRDRECLSYTVRKFNFFASGGGSPLYPEILQYFTMIPRRPWIIVGGGGFEPGTSAPEVWRANVVFTNKRSQAKVYTVYFGISSV